jgi:hypothetical protein
MALHRTRRTCSLFPLFAVAALLAFAPVARAQVFSVGSGPDCTTDSLQAAIDAAGVGYVIRIARDQTYLAQAVEIANRDLRLSGGFDSCSDDTPSGQTVLSGLGGGADSVVTILGLSNVTLENLALIRGDEVYDGYGGGVDFRGAGSLDLLNVGIAQNYAGYGGGVSVIAEGGPVSVVIGSGTIVQLNRAQFSGGGIRIEGDVALRMIARDTALLGNEAFGIDPTNGTPRHGNGGGLQVLAPARADIGSPGYGLAGPIAYNTARYGGGIAIDGTDARDSVATVRSFTTDRDKATRIHGNRATQTGGGIHLLPQEGSFSDPGSDTILRLWDARVDENRAQNGAAIYADVAGGVLAQNGDSEVEFNAGGRPVGLGAVSCSRDVPCNTIDGNQAVTAADVPTGGSIVLLQTPRRMTVQRLHLRENLGGALMRLFGPSSATLAQLLIADNVLSGPVLQIEDGGAAASITHATIAGNTISGAVLSSEFNLTLRNSVVWQPGTTVANVAGLVVDSVVAHEVASLGGGPEALVFPPRFVDPQYGDYQLQAASPAVDFAPDSASAGPDLAGLGRTVDLPIKANLRGPRDLGAFERQAVGNLVLNPSFPARSETVPDHFRRWTIPSPPLVTWSEVEGFGSSAGAAYVRFRPGIDPDPGRGAGTAVAYTGLRQCISLPGPGLYGLTAATRVPGALASARDYARIHWILRQDSPDCSGPATSEGDHYLARSATWSASPEAQIAVSPGEFTINTTIEIALQVLDGDQSGTNAVDAWFDEVSLREIGTGVPVVFGDGFEER